MQYLLMIYSQEGGWSRLSPAEQEQGMAAYRAYTKALSRARGARLRRMRVHRRLGQRRGRTRRALPMAAGYGEGRRLSAPAFENK